MLCLKRTGIIFELEHKEISIIIDHNINDDSQDVKKSKKC